MTDFISGKAAIAGGKPGQGELKWELTKTLRIMKLAAILLFAAAMHVSAKGLTQDKISLSLKNAPLEKVFGEIESQSGFVFIYKDETIKDKRVSIQVSNVTLAQALDQCLKGQELSYRIVGKSIAIKVHKKDGDLTGGEPAGTPPLIDVKGKVLNEKGDPVQGVTVRVKGTEKITLTDKDGEFSLITVERDAVLLFTHITMEAFELKVSGKTELLINLRTKVNSLGEVTVTVNTGYQQLSKERFVGSYSKLDNAAYERRAGMDIITRLDGTVTSMLFNKKGTKSDQLQNLQIRGISTLDNPKSPNKAPLIIVDNFPFRQDLSAINPNDVESITVLKDAAATSIWGAQAGNGVIVITTKKGKYNQTLQASVSSNITIQEKPDQYYYPQMSIADFIDAEIFLFNKGRYDQDLSNTSTWQAISPVVELLAKRRAGKVSPEDSAFQIDIMKDMDLRRDLDRYAYRNAILQQHYINLNGGNGLFSYSFSGGFNRNLNNTQNSRPDDLFSMKANVGFRPVKNLEVITDINYNQGLQRSALFSLPVKTYPYAQLADAEGKPLALTNGRRLPYLDTAGGGKLLDWRYRPLEEPGLTDKRNINRFININFGITYRFTSWLNATVNYQFSNQNTNNNNYRSPATYFTRDQVNQFTNLSQSSPALRNPIPVGGILDVFHAESNSQNARSQLNFNKNFSDHSITAMVAAEFSETKVNADGNRFYAYDKATGAYQSAIDYQTPFPIYGGAFGSKQIAPGSYVPSQSNRFVSFLGNASYSYKSRYTVYGSARKDGSNVFGVNTNRKWKPLWSAGASWDISKESFFHIQSVPSLRLRASYGFTGNPGTGSGLPTIEYNPNLANLTNLVTATPGDAPNPDLRWEKVRMINTGIDFSLFKNRISGSAELWQKKSTDVIALSPYAPSTGVIEMTANIANLKGNGFDINLNTRNVDGVFQWQTGFGLSYAKIIVTKLHSNPYRANDFVNYALHAAEGKVAYGIASFRWEGLDPLTGDPRGYVNKEISTNYNAIFNDSVDNQVFHGSAIPLYFGFLGNTFRWKNFTLSANITYRLNFYFRKPTINYSDLAVGWNGHSDYTYRWQKPGDENYTNVPSFTYPLNTDRDKFYGLSEANVLRGDNVRLQDVRLQYNIDSKKWKNRVFKNISVFVYANNLNVIIWRKNRSGLDPDFTGGSNFDTPTSRTWTSGFNLNF